MPPIANILAVMALATLLNSACRQSPEALSRSQSEQGPHQTSNTVAAETTNPLIEAVRVSLAVINTRRTPVQAAAMFGGKLTTTENKGWWQVTLANSTATILIGAISEGQEATEVDVQPATASSLRLRDLVEVLGDHRTVFESKTSAVKFTVPKAQGVIAYADLVSSKALPDAAVSAVTLRRQ